MKTQPTMNKFHVFTVRKNTRNRQLTYFYLSPCFYTVRAFLLECLLSSYWAVQDFFHVSLRDSNRFSSNCSIHFRNVKVVKTFCKIQNIVVQKANLDICFLKAKFQLNHRQPRNAVFVFYRCDVYVIIIILR